MMSGETKLQTIEPASKSLSRQPEHSSLHAPLRSFLPRLMRGEDLTRTEATRLLDALLDGEATDAQIAAALVALALKGETVEELAGLAEAMRARDTNQCEAPPLHRHGGHGFKPRQDF